MEEKRKVKIVSVVVVVALLCTISVPALAAAQSDPWELVWGNTTASNSLTLKGTNITYPFFTYRVDFPTTSTYSWYYQMFRALNLMLSDLELLKPTMNISNEIFGRLGSISSILFNSSVGSTGYNMGIPAINDNLSQIRDAVAPQYKIDIEENQSDNILSVTNDFLSGSTSRTSLGTSDFSDMKDFLGSASDILASPVSADRISSSLSSGLSSSGGLRFFSSSVHDSLQPDDVSLMDAETVYLDYFSLLNGEVDLLIGGD